MGKYDDPRYAFLSGEAEAAPATPNLSASGAARAMRGQDPRGMESAEEAGVMSGPLVSPPSILGGRVTPLGAQPSPVTLGPEEVRTVPESLWDMPKEQRDAFLRSLPPEEAEKLAARERGDVVRFLAAGGAGGIAGRAAGLATGMAGGAVGGAAGNAVTKIAPIVEGAVGGGVASKAMGGNFLPGAAIGGGLAGLATAMGSVGRFVANRGASRDSAAFREIGRHADQNERDSLVRMGTKFVSDTGRKYGFVGAPNVETARANVMNGVRSVGAEIGAAYDQLGSVGGRPLGDLMVTSNRIQMANRGTRSGEAIADAIHDEMSNLFRIHGGDKNAIVPLGTLRKELTDSLSVGLTGKKYLKLSPAAQAVVQREVADALHHELEIGLTNVARDAKYASIVARLKELNPTYHALKVFEGITGRMATNSPFRPQPSFREKVRASVPLVGAPIPDSKQPMKVPSGRTTAPLRPDQIAGVNTDRPAGVLPPELSAPMAGALSARNRDATAAELGKELFGRPVGGLIGGTP